MTGPAGSLPMGARSVDDKPSDTLVVVSVNGLWTGSSTLPHLHHADRGPLFIPHRPWRPRGLDAYGYGVGAGSGGGAGSAVVAAGAVPTSTMPVIRA